MPWQFRSEGCAGSWPGFVLAGLLAQVRGAKIVHLHRTLRMTGAAMATKLSLACATIAYRLERLAQIELPAPMRRYQRERPGELIHLDIEKMGRFEQPGHLSTGTRGECRNQDFGAEQMITDKGSVYRWCRFTKPPHLLANRHIFKRPFRQRLMAKPK
jgi:hypothetical protein